MAEREPKDIFTLVDGTSLTFPIMRYDTFLHDEITATVAATDEERAHAAIQREFDPDYVVRVRDVLERIQSDLVKAFCFGEELHQQEKGVSATLIRELAKRG